MSKLTESRKLRRAVATGQTARITYYYQKHCFRAAHHGNWFAGLYDYFNSGRWAEYHRILNDC